MLCNCEVLNTLNISNFSDKTTNINYLFEGCLNLSNIILPYFSKKDGCEIKEIFNNCINASNIYFSHFNKDNNNKIKTIFKKTFNKFNIYLIHLLCPLIICVIFYKFNIYSKIINISNYIK